MTNHPFTEARDNLADIIDQVNSQGSPATITRHGRPVAVIVGHDDYESILETLNILGDDDTMAALSEGLEDLDSGD